MSNFLIYKSSAGSGKTYTLVKEYLKIALNNPEDFKHTLAITFTNKAAEEMKTRVIEKLSKLSEGDDKDLEEQLIDEGIKVDIKEQSKKVLSKILHNYSYLSICTIDSFFNKIIRSFTKEFKEHAGYDVETDSNTVLEIIIDDLLNDINENEHLRSYLEKYTYSLMEEDKGWKIEHKIKDIADELFKERFWKTNEGFENKKDDDKEKVENTIKDLSAVIKKFENDMMTFANEAINITDSFGLDVSDFSGGAQRSILVYINRVRFKKTFQEIKDFKPTDTAYGIVAGEKTWYAKASTKKDIIDKCVNAGLGKCLKNITSYFDINIKRYCTARELIKTIYILGIFKDLYNKLGEYRNENKVMLVADFNIILQKIINKSDTPFIYERIGNQFRNYLIDEFQDTSDFQWNNLLPLLDDALSQGSKVVIVGDVKQSIYRWRNGNMKLLLEKAEEDLKIYNSLIIPLNENRRSKKNIIKFNNGFFAKFRDEISDKIKNDLHKKLIIDSYNKDELEQKDDFSKDGGYINIELINYNNDTEEKTKDIADSKVLKIIKEAKKDGFKLGDMLILTRSNNEIYRIAELLSRSNINVISNESLLVSSSPKVRLLVNMLKFIIDKKNSLAQTEVLYNYLTYIKDTDINLHQLFYDHRVDKLFFEKLPKELFGKNKNINFMLVKLNLSQLIEKIISIFSIGNQPDIYLLRFIDIVNDYVKKYSGDVSAFINWWEENNEKHSIIIPENDDAVKVMTIHKAKGLESPLVIIPYIDWIDDTKHKGMLWTSAKEKPFDTLTSYLVKTGSILEESYFEDDYTEEKVMTMLDKMNQLYVAFTRPMERLYVTYPGRNVQPKDNANEKKKEEKIIDFKRTLKSLDGFNETENLFEFGIKERHISKEKESNNFTTDKIYSNDYSSKLALKISKDEFSEKIDKGLLIHKAMSYVKYTDDLEKAIERLILTGLIKESEKESFKNDMKNIINLKEVSNWFTDKFEIKIEAELILPNGKVLRPDRVMLNNNEAIIVDYKTGKENDLHKTQIKEYAEALLSTGVKIVEAYLYYISQLKLVKVY